MRTTLDRPSAIARRRVAISWTARLLDSPALRCIARTRMGRRIRANALVARAIRRLRRASLARVVAAASELESLDAIAAARAGGAVTAAAPPVAPEPSAPTTRFIILCQARTGSNLLQSELNRRWRAIWCAGEQYSARFREPGASTAQITADVFTPRTRHRIVGCRIFYTHLDRSDLQDILALDGMKVVHLRRRNLLRRFVSMQIAFKNQVWMQRPSMPAPSIDERAVAVDVGRFVRDVEETVDAYEYMEKLLASSRVEVLDVWYEDLVADLDTECRRVARFLGAGSPRPAGKPKLARQNPEPLRLLVRNYDEVRRGLSNTPMQRFLDPQDEARGGTRERRAHRTCWPTEQQELLLRAALASPDRAGDAFVEWRNVSDPSDVDDGSRRLFPMLYRNLRRAGLETSMDGELKRSYVDTSVRNQQLFRTLEGVLGRLDDAGVPTLVLKGAALTVLFYGDRGVRPMADLDVMVPRDVAEQAIGELRVDGWEFGRRRPGSAVQELLPVRHSVMVRRGEDELDIHWHPFAECTDTDLDTAFWDTAVDLEIGTLATRALAPADQLLHAFVHGLRYNPVPPLRWIADAYVVIRSTGEDLDWDRLVGLAERHRLVAPVSAALDYLDRRFPDLVPAPALAAVRSLPVTRGERRAFEHVTRAHWVLGSGRHMWRQYRRREPDRGLVRSTVGFLDELRVLYDLDHPRQLPERVVAGVRQRRRRDRDAE